MTADGKLETTVGRVALHRVGKKELFDDTRSKYLNVTNVQVIPSLYE